ncbi:hypothetical protein L1987_50217 [Smallanthus sonchifolius]|uniref:Uncharacterized protein n=1 Tax=Smallanthus sonchifolius TaxID=185202 RepID=A0ACB9FXT8_9ASTR|nr:hypothetical protein L1987_50217 [Smallanthus sonchifolius]
MPNEVEIEVSDLIQTSEGPKSGNYLRGEDSNNKFGHLTGSTTSPQSIDGPTSGGDVTPQIGVIDSFDSVMVDPEISPGITHYGMYSPRREGSDIQSIVWNASNGHYSITESLPERDSTNTGSIELEINSKGPRVLPAVNLTNDTGVDSEGFTVVNRRKKRNGIKVQNKKQKPVVIKPIHQQNKYSHNPNISSTKNHVDVTSHVDSHAQNGIQNSGGRKVKDSISLERLMALQVFLNMSRQCKFSPPNPDNRNTLMCEGSKRKGGWDLSCCIGRGKGRAGTKCTLYTTKKSDERCNMMDCVTDYWCMGSETCMQYTTRGINGEGAGTLHSQNTTLKREESLVIRFMYSGLLRARATLCACGKRWAGKRDL